MNKSQVAGIWAIALLSVSAPAMAAPHIEVIEGRDSPAYTPPDWAVGWLKGECPMFDYTGEHSQVFMSGALLGLSGTFNNRMAVHGLWCDGGPNIGYFAPKNQNSAQTLTWFNSDVGAWPYDWDPYYPKATCPANKWVGGVAWSSTEGLSSIQCYWGAETYRRADEFCYERIFGVDMPAPWDPARDWDGNGHNHGDAPRMPLDWDPGHQKGTCEINGAVAGVSHNRLDIGDQFGGGIHGILCCPSL